MPGKTWEPTKKGARELNEYIRNGTVVYTIRKNAKSRVPRPDYVYAEHVFDWRSPITGHWMTSHLSAAGLLAQEGTVYAEKPDLREIGDPGPQCAPPTSADVTGVVGGGWINVNY